MPMTRKKAKLLKEEKVALAEEFSSRFPADNVSAVWLNIFDKLEHSDKRAFSRAVAKWHEWVAPKRSKLLFREVAPILLENLPPNAILQSRDLCGLWTKELDAQYQNHSSHLLLDFEIGAMNGIPKLTNRFTSTESIQRFMQEMRDHPGNPFVGRSIIFSYFDHVDGEMASYLRAQFWTCATHLLERFGIHVHLASFTLFGRCLAGMELKAHFRNCLLHLPNLRRLDAVGFLSNGRDSNFLRRNPLPRLATLETVTLFTNQEAEFADPVLNSCCVPTNIKRLSIRKFRPYPWLNEAIYGFCNLEVLRSNNVTLRELQRLGNLERKPPLKELSLAFNDNELTAQELFCALEPFGESLVHFQMMSRNLLSPVRGNKVNLPKLERLYFIFFEGSFNIFVQFRSLTELVVKAYQGRVGPRSKRRNEVQVYEFEHRMYDSNIWRFLPKLQTLRVCSRNYERRIFEHRALREEAE